MDQDFEWCSAGQFLLELLMQVQSHVGWASTGLDVQAGSIPWLAANAGRWLGASELLPRAPVHGLQSRVTNQGRFRLPRDIFVSYNRGATSIWRVEAGMLPDILSSA